MTNELIHDIEESIKQDRTNAMLKEYAPTIIVGAVLAVLLTAGMTMWRSHKATIEAQQTSQVIAALEDKDQAAAIEKVIGGLNPGLRGVAQLTDAGLLLRDKKNAEALTAYQNAATDATLPAPWQGFAQLMSVKLQWETGGADAAALLQSLTPILNDATSPWRDHAALQAALIAAHGVSDFTAARQHLATVMQSTSASETLIERAKQLDHLYALKITSDDKPSEPAVAPAAGAPAEKPEG